MSQEQATFCSEALVFAKTWLPVIISTVALALVFRRDFILRPHIKYSLAEYGPAEGLKVLLGREGVPGNVATDFGLSVRLDSVGRRSASNIQVRVRTRGGAYIIQVNLESKSLLVETPPEVGAQGTRDLLVSIPLMVRGEKAHLRFIYGIPDQPGVKPPTPDVLVRHSEGLGKLVDT